MEKESKAPIPIILARRNMIEHKTYENSANYLHSHLVSFFVCLFVYSVLFVFKKERKSSGEIWSAFDSMTKALFPS